MNQTLRALPAVDQVLARDDVRQCLAGLSPERRTEAVRQALQDLRVELQAEAALSGAAAPTRAGLLERAAEGVHGVVRARRQASLRPAINATGVILHTGLGRAPLAPAALEAVTHAAARYCNLELDLDSGERGSRLDHVEGRLSALSGAEAALVVNNNAGAVLLALSALARGREVVVSRGELVEIGGSFRMPDIIEASGARIREVGTTNRTHLRDYEAAIGPQTGLLLVVHPSNYRVRGFTAGVDLPQLVALGHRAAVPVAHDLGGGVLTDLATWNLPREPVVSEALACGVDVVTFSGDKILGGPQAGIAAGRREVVARMRRDPLMRALRCDKLILAALEATLQLYDAPVEDLSRCLPCLQMMTEPVEQVTARAEQLVAALEPRVRAALQPEIVASVAEAGSGALPLAEIPSCGVALSPHTGKVEDLARALRLGDPAVVGRIQRGRLILDLRTVATGEVEPLAAALANAVGE